MATHRARWMGPRRATHHISNLQSFLCTPTPPPAISLTSPSSLGSLPLHPFRPTTVSCRELSDPQHPPPRGGKQVLEGIPGRETGVSAL